jgi:hypothetical protein
LVSELKVEKLWRLHEYTEERKVQLASSEFEGLALIWWDHVCSSHAIDRVPAIITWRAMKEEMRHRFVPANYVRSLYDKLTNLKHGLKTVDEYFYEMDMIMQRAKVREPEDQTMRVSLLDYLSRFGALFDTILMQICVSSYISLERLKLLWPRRPDLQHVLCQLEDAFHHVLPLVVRILVVFVRLVLLVTVRVLL